MSCNKILSVPRWPSWKETEEELVSLDLVLEQTVDMLSDSPREVEELHLFSLTRHMTVSNSYITFFQHVSACA